MGADSFTNLKFSELLVVKFGGWPWGLNVFWKEPYLAIDFESGYWKAGNIGLLGLSCLSVGHFRDQGLVESFERLDELDGLCGGGNFLLAWVHINEELGVEPIVCVVRGDIKWFSDGVVVGELCQG